MTTSERRKKILTELNQKENPISARILANIFKVSRQVIVGDIALLRAEGFEILSTPRGYLLPVKEESDVGTFIGKIVCQHTIEKTDTELHIIVDNGGEVMDVIVEHPLYGSLSGSLRISSRQDIDEFLLEMKKTKTKMLASLTDGIHIHTIKCADRSVFERIKSKLDAAGILYS